MDKIGTVANTTPLYTLHRELDAKIVEFANYQMPLNYPSGIITEHRQVRESAGLFDVSHMGQIKITGDNAAHSLESLLPTDLSKLDVGRQRYSFLTLETGGILDDLMVSRFENYYLLVVNASNKHQDFDHISASLPADCTAELLDNRSLLALQGPLAREVMARFSPDLSTMQFMDTKVVEVEGINCQVFCSGYTGEDGFEIATSSDDALVLAQLLLDQTEVQPAGLGARDSLRLEAGLCLHGNDIHPNVTPVAAGLSWAIPASRRKGGSKTGGFPGSEPILLELENGPALTRVGIQPEGRAPVRAHSEIVIATGESIGEVSSGSYGPTVGRPIAMGYVKSTYSDLGTELQAMVRGKPLSVKVCDLPFVQHNYKRI